MQVSVTFRNTEPEEWFKKYVNEEIKRLNKYVDKPFEAHVVLTIEKFRNVAEINIISKGIAVNSKEEAKDMQIAFDSVLQKVERQIKKHKEKIRSHKEVFNRVPEVASEGIADTDGQKLVETRRVVLKPMNLEDAILEIEESRNNFVIFRDLSTERIMILFRRDDGDFGLVEAV